MTEKRPRRGDRLRAWLRSRGVWFWAGVGTVASLILLWGGSQIAHDRRQSVTWYTGFGQWLGALGSLIAAGVALWIAVSERRHAERQREADLAREAGLVEIITNNLGRPDIATGVSFSAAGVGVQNRRSDRIFDIEVTQFVMGGEAFSLKFETIYLSPKPEGRHYQPSDLRLLAINPDQVLTMFPKGLRNIPAEYVEVRYTDSSGRRWQVDTDRKVRRIM